MIKKVMFLLILLSSILYIQCSGDLFNSMTDDPVFLDVEEGRGGGGGKQDLVSELYGDLIVCLRDEYGIPQYRLISGEHGDSYYPLPIKYSEGNLLPVMDENGNYQTFNLSDEGDVIPEEGFLVREVDFGRLNIVRAPQSVINQALKEAIDNLTQSGVSGYKTDASGRLVAIIGEEDWLVNFDSDEANTPEEYDDKTIDSPRENIAIYQELMTNEFTGQLNFLINNSFQNGEKFEPADLLRLAFGAIAAGADKTGIITIDEIAYMNNWLLDLEEDSEIGSPDVLERFYFNFSNFRYNRVARYESMYVQKTELNPDGTWVETYVSLLDALNDLEVLDRGWTSSEKLVRYGDEDTNITGFAKAADDAVQVLDFIHESDLISYSPYFTADGFVSP